MAQFIQKQPLKAIKLFEEQLGVQVQSMQDEAGAKASSKNAQQASDLYFPKKVRVYHINFEGNFGANHVTPRGLKANLVN